MEKIIPMIHFQEQQVGKLLDVIAIGHAIVAEDITVVLETLHNCRRGIIHVLTREYLFLPGDRPKPLGRARA